MKKVLLLMVACLMISSVSMASHIGIYSDVSGASCSLAPGQGFNATVIEKFSTGSTGVRFGVAMGSNVFFAMTSPFTAVGALPGDLSLAYGQCLNGSIVLSSMFNLLSGGTLQVIPAAAFPNIIITNCQFGEVVATGGTAYVGGTGNCNEVATESSTWGQVKALYR